MADNASTVAAGDGSPPSPAASPGEAHAIEAVRRALRDIEYGSVLITIHQGEVVGIETSTKVRLKGS